MGTSPTAHAGFHSCWPSQAVSTPLPYRLPSHCHRHIFESKKYVEEYRSEDVQSELGVGRAELARLAQLLGGDYCEGVAGALPALAVNFGR